MSRIKDLIFEDNVELFGTEQDIEPTAGIYPKKLHVDGYDVNHYHDGDVPVYEILDDSGNIIEIAHSTNEMHEITGRKKGDGCGCEV